MYKCNMFVSTKVGIEQCDVYYSIKNAVLEIY